MTTPIESKASPKRGPPLEVDTVTIRFAGDSGDGMQLVGSEFMKASAAGGNDLATLPDYPAEIRAPAGTTAGVSGFQIQFGSREIYTPGDAPDVLVAMNPAALKANLAELKRGGIIIVNFDAFTERNLATAEYEANPLDDDSLEGYTVHKIDIAKLTANALDGLSMSQKDGARCKNYFALGLMFWMYNRDIEPEIKSIKEKFSKKEPIYAEANTRVFRAGFNFGETAEILDQFKVPPAVIKPGRYRHVTGNQATALGLLMAARLAGTRLFLGSYPITPASEILHELSNHKNYGAITFQAEDEIAAVTSAIGAAFGGALAATSTSGPGLALKSEGMSLAVMLELPLVIVDVQRGGPSTGLPTKTEQSDLLCALYGRHGEAPLPVVCAWTPSDCFDAALEAARLALKYMTPVLLLSDGYLSQGTEPWRIPEMSSLPKLAALYRKDPEGFSPYLRDEVTLARPWAIPGTPGLEHRIGGLEKDYVTGDISYDPVNHERMTLVRAKKVAGIANDIPGLHLTGEPQGDLLVVGWGSTYGFIASAVEELRARGKKVSHAHFRHLNPMPRDTGEVLRRFRRVLIPELNSGQMRQLLRKDYLVDGIPLNKMQGKPFKVSEIVAKIEELLALS
jgi:2-oxoglutarate ferredoxin oxidoreductase subunit alpha